MRAEAILRLATLLWLCLCCFMAHAGERYRVDSLLRVLDAVIDSSAYYDARLHQDLVSYRTANDNTEDDETRFALAHTLFKTYRKIRLDSALYFARQRVQHAQRLKYMKQYEFALTGSNESILKVTIPHRALFAQNDSTMLISADAADHTSFSAGPSCKNRGRTIRVIDNRKPAE